jgi:serine/threonine protein kinase
MSHTKGFYSNDKDLIQNLVHHNHDIIQIIKNPQKGGEKFSTLPKQPISNANTQESAESLPITVTPSNVIKNYYDDFYAKSPENPYSKQLPITSIVSSKYPEKYNYTVLKQYGKGSYGQAYLVKNNITNSRSVIKVIPLTYQSKPSAFNEVHILKSLKAFGCKRINILCYEDSFVDTIGNTEYMFIVTKEFPDSINLESFKDNLKSSSKLLNTHSLLMLFKDLLAALSFLHSKNIAHADIKPGNILVNKSLQIQLIDFGISCDKPSVNVKNKCVVTGTKLFQAPELLFKLYQYTSREELQKGDVFSMGLVFFELADLALPFGDSSFNCLEYFYKEVGGFDTTTFDNTTPENCKPISNNLITSSYSYIPSNLSKIDYAKYSNINKSINKLIQRMLDTNPDTRPSVFACVNALNKIINAFNSIPLKKEFIAPISA